MLLEIGVEEMPADDVTAALAQAKVSAQTLFDELRLTFAGLDVFATPRRIVVIAREVAPRQSDEEFVAKGPPADRAFDADGNPTRAATGFARGKGVEVADLLVKDLDGGSYVTAAVRNAGKPATEVLSKALPGFIDRLKFSKSMRWNTTDQAFSRPIRWIAALFGEAIIPFEFAGVVSGNITRGLRPSGSVKRELTDAASYRRFCRQQGILLDAEGAQRSDTRTNRRPGRRKSMLR